MLCGGMGAFVYDIYLFVFCLLSDAVSVFTGRRVRALAWCPTTIHSDKKQHQFLAAVCDVNDGVNYMQDTCQDGESVLQIWNFKTDL